ncbi:unnamed protein product, partial [Didymodactylos carnosus]
MLNDDTAMVAKRQKQSVNEINNIDADIQSLTATIVNETLTLFVQLLNKQIRRTIFDVYRSTLIVKCPALNIQDVTPELHYNDPYVLRKIYFLVLYFVINKHYLYSPSNSREANSNLGKMLNLIVMHDQITTQDICLYGTIVNDSSSMITLHVYQSSTLSLIIQLLKNILNIPFVKRIYLDLINDEARSDKQINMPELDEIIDNIINEIFVKRGISFANLSMCFSGVTCFNRTVILNKNVVIPALLMNEQTLEDNAVMNASIILIIIHEFFHILRRTTIPRAFDLFCDRTPKRPILSRNNELATEGGTQVEDRLFGVVCGSMGFICALFLLDIRNWDESTHENFKLSFQTAKLQDEQADPKKQNIWYLPDRASYCTHEEKDDNCEIKIFSQSPSNCWKLGICATPYP